MTSLPLLLLACFDPSDGTAVGNPATAGITGIDIPQDVFLEVGEVDVKYLVLKECHGGTVTKWVGDTVDLLEDAEYSTTIGAGRWCGMSLAIGDGGLYLSGETAEGTPFDIELQPEETVPLARRFKADGQHMLVAVVFDELFDAKELDELGGYVRAYPGDPLADEWAERLSDSVLLVEDVDEDGFVGIGDFTIFDPLSREEGDAKSAPQSAACSSGVESAGLVALFASLVLMLGRRRRGR